MDYRTNAAPDGSWRTSLALLSRLPIVRSAVHSGNGVISRPLLEVGLEEESGAQLTVFVNHLVASFWQGRGGDAQRRKEVQAILQILRANHEPHVLMGDFNALAPGDRLRASRLLGYLAEADRRYRGRFQVQHEGYPSLNYVVPPPLRFLNPFLQLIPRSRVLSAFFDGAASLYAPRASIGLLLAAGYIDCFRLQHPQDQGFTCPAATPAGRIDYLFANSSLAARLSACRVIEGTDEVSGKDASDHLPVVADFRTGTGSFLQPALDHLIESGEPAGEAR
jgi:endonuclease/exonuclease/phosphatase family metal-dependent hydrolase